MLEENKNTELAVVENNVSVPASLDANIIQKNEENIVKDIIAADNHQELEKQFGLFNDNQVKKNALRIIKLNNLLNKVEDQALERFEKRPDQISNKELIDYMNAVSNQIEKAQNFNKETLNADVGGIKIKQEKTEVNINVAPTLSKDGKDKVVDVISQLLKQMQQPNTSNNAEDIIEVEEAPYVEAEVEENNDKIEKDIVYNNVLNDESEDN